MSECLSFHELVPTAEGVASKLSGCRLQFAFLEASRSDIRNSPQVRQLYRRHRRTQCLFFFLNRFCEGSLEKTDTELITYILIAYTARFLE